MSNRISELEGVVLGLIWTNPDTPYQVRRILQRSPNPGWSGSAGAIYPLFRRLARSGHLTARRVKTGKREGKIYSITNHGTRALRTWIAPPLLPTTIGVPVDALRTRVRFLAVLDHGARSAFLEDAIARLQRHMTIIRADCRQRKASGDLLSYFTARGALLSCGARLRWLVEVREAFVSGSRTARIRGVTKTRTGVVLT